MEICHSFTFYCGSEEAAAKNFDIIKDVFDKNRNRGNPETIDILLDNIKLNYDEVTIDCAPVKISASDSIAYYDLVLTIIFCEIKNISFTGYITDEFESVCISAEVEKDSNILVITFLYYPEGYNSIAHCEQCADEIMERDEWDGITEYVKCNNCGAYTNVAELFAMPERFIEKRIDLNGDGSEDEI